jgi:membrane protein
VFQALRIAVVRLLELDVPVVAGGLAFFGVLSVFPSIALALLAYGLLAVPGEASLLANALQYLLPEAAHDIIMGEFRLLANWAAHHIGFGVGVTIALVLWSAMAGWKALISGIRLVTGEERRLTIIGYQFQSFILSFLFIGALAIAIMGFILLVRVVRYEAVVGAGASGSN